MRLIDADALKKEIAKRTPHFAHRIAFALCFDAIKNAPTVDAVPVKHGHWIEEDEEIIEYKCSECGVYQYGNFGEILNGEFHFCPNCGAKMDVERKDE